MGCKAIRRTDPSAASKESILEVFAIVCTLTSPCASTNVSANIYCKRFLGESVEKEKS